MAGKPGTGNKAAEVPHEWEGVARKDDITHVNEKLDRCYTKDKYDEFQGAVEAISLKALEGTAGRNQIRCTALEAIKDYKTEVVNRGREFWVPVGISIIGALTGIGALVVSILKP